jgi:hypothetical protein
MTDRNADMRHILSQVQTLTGGTVVEAEMPTGQRDPAAPVYLRVGTWNPDRPISKNYATGSQEAGLSVYELDRTGKPITPSEGEWAEDDMQDRLASSDPKFLVQGMVVGRGGDGEPVLDDVRVVGMWHPVNESAKAIAACIGVEIVETPLQMTRKGVAAGLPSMLPATPENIARAKAFVMKKWIERHYEQNGSYDRPPPAPTDLSNACKFSSLFAQAIFGGKLRGNEGHQFVELPDGQRLDLNFDAADVIRMTTRFEQDGKKGWLKYHGDEFEEWHGDPYSHDPKFFGNPDHINSMKSILPRVKDWVHEFLRGA